MTHAIAHAETGPPRWSARCLAAMLLCMAAAAIGPIAFLPQQSLWVDETTQLSGLTLGPVEVTHWLAGEEPHRFGVPPDRSPPVSYWVGMAWSSIVGLNEASLRWLGVLCVVLAAAFVFDAARRAWGMTSAVVAGLLFGLSPNAVVNAVEIRSYPVFILMSAVVFWCLIGWLGAKRGGGWWLAGLAAACVVAVFTHFFGILLAGAACCGAFVGGWIAKRPVRWVVLTGLVVGAAALGIKPFVDSASKISGANAAPPAMGVGELAKFMYRALHGHPALGSSMPVAAVVSLAFVALGIISLLPKRRGNDATWAMVVALASGMAVAAAVAFMFSTFNGLHPSYNLWRLPALAVLFASVTAVRWKPARTLGGVAACMLIGGELFAVVQLARHGEWFAHGPHRRIARIIHELGPSNVAVIHDGSFEWGQGYYPLRYEFGAELPQFKIEDLGFGPRLARLPQGEIIAFDDAPADVLIIMHMKDVGWSELADALRTGGQPFADGSANEWYRSSPRWKPAASHLFYGMFAADVRAFTHQPASEQPTS